MTTPQTGCLIVNADDWGRDRENTDRILDCVRFGSVSAVSAMVFMEDSERSVDLARTSNIDAGLHLNMTTLFVSKRATTRLMEHHQRVVAYFSSSRYARVVFNPFIASSVEYVVRCQLEEYEKLYGSSPSRLDGHHHMHLCSNVMVQGLLPAGTQVRRNFSFLKNEKSSINIAYRKVVDSLLARRHTLTDFLFSLVPLVPSSRLCSIFALAQRFLVEVETHPVNPAEFNYLTDSKFWTQVGQL
jgi:chitin disaccharide deacetylase